MNYYAGFGVIFLFFTGLYFDQKFHTGYFWAITGVVVGFIYICYEIWKIMRK